MYRKNINEGFCIVEVTDDFASGNGTLDGSKMHCFTLFRTDDDKIYRFEAYANIYCSRYVEWPTWEQDLIKLITMSPGEGRLEYWNGLFSANETGDIDYSPMIVTIYDKSGL